MQESLVFAQGGNLLPQPVHQRDHRADGQHHNACLNGPGGNRAAGKVDGERVAGLLDQGLEQGQQERGRGEDDRGGAAEQPAGA